MTTRTTTTCSKVKELFNNKKHMDNIERNKIKNKELESRRIYDQNQLYLMNL